MRSDARSRRIAPGFPSVMRCWRALGVRPGPAPDRFLAALAVLSLFCEVAEHHPLVCLVDDEWWLDRASSQVLAFVARRLQAESVGVVFAARNPSPDRTLATCVPADQASDDRCGGG